MSNVRNTPQAIGTSGGTDNQGSQQDNLAAFAPNTVDALPGMQYPDMPGGPDVNAPLLPFQTAHPASTADVVDPSYGPAWGMQQYGTLTLADTAQGSGYNDTTAAPLAEE